jgi:signal peptidase I
LPRPSASLVRRALAYLGLALGAVLAIALLALVLLLATGTLKPYAVSTPAMEPTLHCAQPTQGCEGAHEDRALALTRFVSYGRGDLVVFDPPPAAKARCGIAERFVKRIVGLPGERLELRSVDGVLEVYVDGGRLAEPYVDAERRTSRRAGTYEVPDDAYFVLGDNRAQSCDSRVWGPLPATELRGKLVATYWPPDRLTIR